MAKKKKVDISSFEQQFPCSRRFIEVDEDGAGKGLFYFHEIGDYLFGYLLARDKKQTLHYQFVTYTMKVIEARQDGCDLIIHGDFIVEFPGNLKLRRILEDNELIRSLVKIVYKGKRGRYKKYDVFKDKGTFFKDEEPQYGRKKTTRRKRKPDGKSARAGVTATA